MVSRLRTLWCVAIALAVLFSAAVAFQRWTDDSRYLSVDICVEFESAIAHSDMLGYTSIARYLSALRESGATSIAIREPSFEEIIGARGLTVFTGLEILNRDALTPISLPAIRTLIDSGEIRTESLYVVPGDGELASMLGRWFAAAALESVAVELLGAENRPVIEITGIHGRLGSRFGCEPKTSGSCSTPGCRSFRESPTPDRVLSKLSIWDSSRSLRFETWVP